MSLLAAALAEKMRRGRIEERLRGAIKNRFEIIARRRWEATAGAERVRCTDVYAACAEALERAAIANDLCRAVKAAVVKMGAVPIRDVAGRHMFAFMRRRVSAAEVASETKRWEARLAAEGMGANESKPWKSEDGAVSLTFINHARTGVRRGAPLEARRLTHEVGAAHFDRARDRYWKLERDRNILELYAMEGRTIREIAAALDLGRDVVHRTITRLVAPAGQGDPSEDSDEEDG